MTAAPFPPLVAVTFGLALAVHGPWLYRAGFSKR
jgi:hypothetical protein